MKEIWGQDEKIRSVLKKQKLNSFDQYIWEDLLI